MSGAVCYECQRRRRRTVICDTYNSATPRFAGILNKKLGDSMSSQPTHCEPWCQNLDYAGDSELVEYRESEYYGPYDSGAIQHCERAFYAWGVFATNILVV